MSAGFLATMAAASRARAQSALATCARAEMERRAFASPAPPSLMLSPRGFDIIAETKLRSPAVGALREAADENIAARVQAYAAAGAAAVSVLTEPSRFDGSLQHLAQAAEALAVARVPAMRKDFLVDPYQVMEARVAGAGGVLVILRMLARAEIEALTLSQAIEFAWIGDGDHDLGPRGGSGYTRKGNLAAAADAVAAFAARVIR